MLKTPVVDERHGIDDELTVPWSSMFNKKDKKEKGKKKKEVVLARNCDWESDYDSDSFKMASLESSDCSDFEETSSRTKKDTCNIFNPNTPMKYIEFQTGLMFMSVKVLKNAIIDYDVE